VSWVKYFGCMAFIATVSSVTVWAMQAGNTRNLQSLVAAAREAQARSDFAGAADCYEKAVKLSPTTPELWANLGLMYHQTGRFPEAIKSFSEAARLNRSMFVPQLFLGIDYLELKHAETAIPFLQRAETINPTDPQPPLALGRAFAISDRGDRAGDAYWTAVTLAPGNGNAWLGLGMANLQQVASDARMMRETYKDSVYARVLASETLAEQGKLVQAADAYKFALRTTSSPFCAHAGYGIVLLREQEVSQAHGEFDLELKFNPGCSLARLGLAAMHLVQGDAEGALREIVTIWNADQGFLQENLPLLRDAISAEQSEELLRMVKDREIRGDIPAESKDGTQTGSQVDGLVSQGSPVGGSSGPNSEPVVVPRISKETEMFYSSGQYRKCSESMRPRLSVLPETSLLLLAPCAFYTGDYRTASLAAGRLRTNSATHPIGLYWESKADQKLAIAALTRAGETDANSPLMHVLLGDIYRQKEQWEDAEEEYRKALALEPQNKSASLGLAISLFSHRKNEEAFAIDQVLLRETPDDFDGNLLAGEILVQRRLFADAEIYLNKCRVSKQKLTPRLHTLLGEVYAATNRIPEALAEFNLALANDQDGSIHYRIGRLYQEIGDKKKADEAFRASKQLVKQWDDRVILGPQQDSTDTSRE
jgi:tetratricopeptide (TPR) repeat protein